MTSSSQPKTDRLPRTIMGAMLRPALWPTLIRAVAELALARWRLGRRKVCDLLGASHAARLPSDKSISSTRAATLATRVAWAIPHIAARVPWRSDCLVQATAAQRWLNDEGLQTRLHIGVRKDRPAGFEAHAWLCYGTQIVTGGDISGFVPLVPPQGDTRESW